MKSICWAAPLLLAAACAAHAQTAPAKVTVDDVKKLISTIEADAKRVAAYCEMSKLYNEAYEAGRKKDDKKAEELGKKADEMGKSLGGDYERIMDGLQEIDPASDDGKVVIAAFEPLEKKCN
ncbi:MAG: hypothetical protein NW215_05510 [Hyphomicrobiales bacterium]|nr:hypothetical protein [Hyphomicrobiales bacterium]